MVLMVEQGSAFVAGVILVGATLVSALRTVIIPRGINDWLTRLMFILVFSVYQVPMKYGRTYERRDSILASYAPISLLSLPVLWLTLTLLGYTLMFWAVGVGSVWEAFHISGSSLFTLGFATVDGFVPTALVFTEAAMGLGLLALVISYLPTIYAAFSRREAAVTMLTTRAGNPPSAVEMIIRFHLFHGLERLVPTWATWEALFAEMEESHTSLGVLSFFRSHEPHLSWVTATGAVLDGAALILSAVDTPNQPNAHLCIRAGYLCLRAIARYLGIPYDPDPRPDDPISISREEFDDALLQMQAAGVPLKADRDQAWRDYAGWRVNYDFVLRAIAGLVYAPYAPWSSDRALPPRRLRFKHTPDYGDVPPKNRAGEIA